MPEFLFRVECQSFVAGIVTNDSGIVIVTAPILKWLLGKRLTDHVEYIVKRYKATIDYIITNKT